MDVREISFDILRKIEEEDLYVSDVLGDRLRQLQFKDKRDRAFIKRLVEGVIERRISLDYLIDKLSKGKKRPDVRMLLRMGIYQIRYMDKVPDRAAISETVELAKKKGYAGLQGYINGVLRNVQKLCEEKRFDSYIVSSMETRFSTPKWLCDFLIKTYDKETALKILSDQFAEHDTVVRINSLKTDTAQLRDLFESRKVKTEEGKICPERCIRIKDYDMVKRLPGYREGLFSVQDETSVYAVSHIGIKPGDKVLDLCASPGGKTLLAYELTNNDGKCGLIYSRDISETKTEKIMENAERLEVPISSESIKQGVFLQISDATELDKNLVSLPDEEKMDVVIADVPCSGLGIIGRKNDIKYHTSPEAMAELSDQGLKILKNASKYIKSSGRLCFSTCTINPGENGEVVRKFLEGPEGAGFQILEERTFLQGIDGSDGFYFCVLARI